MKIIHWTGYIFVREWTCRVEYRLSTRWPWKVLGSFLFYSVRKIVRNKKMFYFSQCHRYRTGRQPSKLHQKVSLKFQVATTHTDGWRSEGGRDAAVIIQPRRLCVQPHPWFPWNLVAERDMGQERTHWNGEIYRLHSLTRWTLWANILLSALIIQSSNMRLIFVLYLYCLISLL